MSLPQRRPSEEFEAWIARLEAERIRGLAEHHEHMAEVLEGENGGHLSTSMQAEIRAQRAAAREFRAVLTELEEGRED